MTRPRLGGLDALRALAMLLGLGYHAAYAYVPDVGPWYAVADPSSDEAFRVLTGVVHAVRMPVFFALAGFFAQRGLRRRGPGDFLAERARRLLVPLAVALPLSVAADVAVRTASQRAGLMDAAYPPGTAVRWAPLHLWFLEYLFLCSLAAWAVAKAWPGRALRLTTPGLTGVTLGLGAITALVAVHVQGTLQPDATLWPEAASLAVYGAYFAFGAALAICPESLPSGAGVLAPVGLALALWVYSRHLQWESWGHALGMASGWLVTVGALRLALAAGALEAAWVRPLVDASYWVYLVHYPLVGALQVAVAPTALPPGVKYALVVAGTLAVTFSSHRWLVQGTWLAPWLGVRR